MLPHAYAYLLRRYAITLPPRIIYAFFFDAFRFILMPPPP